MRDNPAADNSESSTGRPGRFARVAVLMTCHNRCAETLACLASLAGQAHFDPAHLFLVDDGSDDGTGDAVRAAYPTAQVIAGDGTLYWNGGMRRAWEQAKVERESFDYYLWLNDDVVLFADTLAMLVCEARALAGLGGAVIVAAATLEPRGTQVTYGGHHLPEPERRPLRLQLIEPSGVPQGVATISGNIVLVSAAAEASLGNLDAQFEHIYGDLDYGLRAREAGIPVFLASRPGGTCAANQLNGTSRDPGLPRLQRLALLWREGRRIHARDWRRFVATHGGGGLAVLAHRLSPYLRILLARPHRHAQPKPRIAESATAPQ